MPRVKEKVSCESFGRHSCWVGWPTGSSTFFTRHDWTAVAVIIPRAAIYSTHRMDNLAQMQAINDAIALLKSSSAPLISGSDCAAPADRRSVSAARTKALPSPGAVASCCSSQRASAHPQGLDIDVLQMCLIPPG